MSASPVTKFGKYELIERIAAGGMAEIYTARFEPAPGVTKRIVIKKILPHYADNRAFIAMFTNEAKIAIRLSHGNIAQVFDFGAIDGEYFLAMELVDGPPLSKVMKRARGMELLTLPPAIATHIAIELLKGLHYAHTRLDDAGKPLSIVHRDMSPQNVLVGYEGQVKIVDFGIARARNAGSAETQSEVMKGKYSYFAPEQAKGRDLDSRADIFAAGIVLYEMVTGQLPFQGKPMEALTKLVRGQFPRPSSLNPAVSPALERIILKAMALERNDRFQTAEAFQLELAKYLAQYHREFAVTDVSMLMQLLFEEELVREGRPVALPREFMEKALKWKTPGAQSDAESPTDNTILPEKSEPSLPPVQSSQPSEAKTLALAEAMKSQPVRAPASLPVDQKPRRQWVLPALMVIGAALLGIVAVLAFHQFSLGTIEIVTTPRGALVSSIDGLPTKSETPATFTKLEGGRDHRIELSDLKGHEWKADVYLKRGQHLIVEHTFETAVAPVKVVPPVDPPKPPVLEARDVVTWPVESLALDVARHHVNLSKAGAASVALDAQKAVKVWLAPGSTFGWGFHVVNSSGAAPGTFSGTPFMIEGASRLLAFHIPNSVMLNKSVPDDMRPRRLFTWPAGAMKATVTPVLPTLEFPATQRVVLSELDPQRQYTLVLRQGTPAASLRGSPSDINRVLVGTETGLQVLALNEPLIIHKTHRAWFTVLDDQSDDQQGQLIIDVKETTAFPSQKPR